MDDSIATNNTSKIVVKENIGGNNDIKRDTKT